MGWWDWRQQHPHSGGRGGAMRPLWTPLMRGGAPVWRAAPALSLSLWPWLPVISHPLSECILGSNATRASVERCVSLFVSPHLGFSLSCQFFFMRPSFVSFLLLISPSSLLPPPSSILRPPAPAVTLRLVTPTTVISSLLRSGMASVWKDDT